MTSRTLREDDLFIRPQPEDLRSTWNTVFSDPLLSLPNLKAAALSRHGLGPPSSDGGVLIRSVYWRFYHGLLPPPTSLDLFSPSLQASRAAYSALRRRYLIAPDGRWAADCSGADEYDDQSVIQPSAGPSEWDPLSLDGGSPWKAWFAQLELRATIRQDVERTFPDMPYFQIERVRTSLVTVLFLFAVLNPDVGYRQGMHEILAVCFLVLDRDSLDPEWGVRNLAASGKKGLEEAMLATLDRRYVEHDAFGLFQGVMRGAKAFYEWRAEEGPRTRTPSTTQAPIIVRCNHIHSNLIRRIDPQLWERLETEGVEAQIWAIRWIRLIFTRELPFHLAMQLWDGIFAEDPGLGLLDFICVAMLLLIRNELLDADYPTLLTHLLHYPAPSSAYAFSPYMILTQALYLRNNISPAAGVQVVIQNQEVLGVKAQPPERAEDTLPPRGRAPPRAGALMGKAPKPGRQGIAAGLFERAQAAGLDRAFMSTVADLRKNLPDSATAYSYLPNLPFSPTMSPSMREAAAPFSAIPTSSSTPFRSQHFTPSPVISRPTPQTRISVDSTSTAKTILDAERELAELRLAMMGMGKAMAEWLSALPHDSSCLDDSAGPQVAWKGLERLRDTLLDAAGTEVDDIAKEWGWHEGLQAPKNQGMTPNPVAEEQPPVPDDIVFDAGFMDTPTTPVVAVMPSTPSLPVRTTSPQMVSSHDPRIPLHISSRGDRPMAALPRVPVSAPASAGPSRSPTGGMEPAAFTEGGIQQATRTYGAGEIDGGGKEKVNADPLAGIGVGSRKSEEGRRPGGRDASRGGGGVDPLLGVGVR